VRERELSMKDAKPSTARSRQARLEGARQPQGARAARQKRRPRNEEAERERELEGGSRKGREGVCGERPPSQARRSQTAAGREGPRGRSFCLAKKEAESEGSRELFMKDAKASTAQSCLARLKGASLPRGARARAARAAEA
jgi:hypothetical protein